MRLGPGFGSKHSGANFCIVRAVHTFEPPSLSFSALKFCRTKLQAQRQWQKRPRGTGFTGCCWCHVLVSW